MVNPYQDYNFGVYWSLLTPCSVTKSFSMRTPRSSQVSNDWYPGNPMATSYNHFDHSATSAHILLICIKIYPMISHDISRFIYDLFTSTESLRWNHWNHWNRPCWEVLLVGGFGGEPFNSGSPSGHFCWCRGDLQQMFMSLMGTFNIS